MANDYTWKRTPNRCPVCGKELHQTGGWGRRREYDSDACKMRAYRERKKRAELDRVWHSPRRTLRNRDRESVTSRAQKG